MERADFIHLVRLSEQASAQDSAAYRRSVALFAGLGYAWVVGCFAVAGGTRWWLVTTIGHGRLRSWHAWMLLGAIGLLWTSARALWCRIDPPAGLRLQRSDAPALFDALERIRRKIKGPPLHEVLIDGDFNAAIQQRARWGVFGGARNYLSIGLPLLMALDRQRLLAVLAHEYGHLRGDHGRFAAWVYRARASWTRLYEALDDESGPAARLTRGFFSWYFPRFVARSFALARQDEYEVDRIAAKLVGAHTVGDALVEIALKSDWLAQEFWGAHWLHARSEPLPLGPYARMHQALRLPLDEGFARASLRRALRSIPGVDDTHPVLRDRLEALGAAAALPAWSRRPALELLGPDPQRWLAHFDQRWGREHATAWKRHHARLTLVQARVDLLLAQAHKSAEEWVELANLQRRLDARAPVHVHCEHALAQTPGHVGALKALCHFLPEERAQQRLACLARLHESASHHCWWSARQAVDLLEADPAHDAQALKLWRARLKEGEAAEARAWQEATTPPFFTASGPPAVSELELAELRFDLDGCAPVTRAWLVSRRLREFPARQYNVLVVDLPDMDDDDRFALCRQLESTVALPGSTLVLWPGHSPTLAEVQRHAGAPFHAARGSR